MRPVACLAALALGCVGLSATPAAAAEWAPTARTPNYLTEIDVASAEVKQDVAKVWIRETYDKPKDDEEVHKPYVVELRRYSQDCENRTYALGEFVRRDKDGHVIRSGPASGGWKSVIPGTVGENSWKAACAIVHPQKDKAYGEEFADHWRSLGQSEDQTYVLWINTDSLVKLDDDHVYMVTRMDYAKPRWTNGYGIRFELSASVTDCKNERHATVGSDFYISPNLRVAAYRVDAKDAQFVSVAPATFLGHYMGEICNSAKPLNAKASVQGEDEKLKFFTGTAWGADKGYLVTAAHVIEDAKAIDVYRDGDKVGEAKIVVADFANDLAILAFTKGPAAKLKTLPMAPRGPALGRAVFTLGYPAPGILGQQVKMTAGQVNGTAGLQDDTRMLQISVPVQGGNSGGPVMSWDGAVVGIVDSKMNRLDEEDHERPENINYAVKSSYLRPMLEDLPDLGNHEPVKFGPTQERTVAAVREAVFMLLVAR
jgi:S1-C subfamily serine protease